MPSQAGKRGGKAFRAFLAGVAVSAVLLGVFIFLLFRLGAPPGGASHGPRGVPGTPSSPASPAPARPAPAPQPGSPSVRPAPPPIAPTPPRPGTSEAGAFSITLPAGELQSVVRQGAAAHVDDLDLRLETGALVFTGRVRAMPLRPAMRVELEPYAEDGQVRVRVRRATMARIPLPGALVQEVVEQVERELAREQNRHPGLVVETVQVTPQGISIAGRMGE